MELDRPPNARTVGTVTAGVTGLGLGQEYGGDGPLRFTQITMDSTFAPTITRNGTTSAYGSQKIYTFPSGQIKLLGAYARFVLTRGETTNMTSGAAFYVSLGSAAVISTDAATIVDTKCDFLSPQLATLSGGTVTQNFINKTAVTIMTDSSGGTANDTIAAITAGGAYAQADLTALKNAAATWTAKINQLIRNVGSSKFVAYDGGATAPDLYVNISNSNGASAQVATGNSSLVMHGVVNLVWMNEGYLTT